LASRAPSCLPNFRQIIFEHQSIILHRFFAAFKPLVVFFHFDFCFFVMFFEVANGLVLIF